MLIDNVGKRTKTVIFYTSPFGKRSETWIYRQVCGLQRYSPHVATHQYINSDQFAFPHVHILGYRSRTAFRFAKGFHSVCQKRPVLNTEVRTRQAEILLKRLNPAIVHIHFLWNIFKAEESLVPAATKCGIPIVVTAHGSDINRCFVDPHFRDRLSQYFEKISRFIGVSEFICQRLYDIGCPPQCVKQCYLGVPIPLSMPACLPEDEIRVICVGSFGKVKGHCFLVRAFAQAAQEEQRLKLVLVGSGEQEDVIKKLVDKLHINEKVQFCGWLSQEKVQAELRHSHIYAQHSVTVHEETGSGSPRMRIEALGISFVEAAANGLALIGTHSGGIPEICRDGYNGFLVDEKDIDGMAKKILLLARDTELRNGMGANSRRLAEDEFDIKKQTAKLELLYDEIASGPSMDSHAAQ